MREALQIALGHDVGESSGWDPAPGDMKIIAKKLIERLVFSRLMKEFSRGGYLFGLFERYEKKETLVDFEEVPERGSSLFHIAVRGEGVP